MSHTSSLKPSARAADIWDEMTSAASSETLRLRRPLVFLLSALTLSVPVLSQPVRAASDQESAFAAMVNDVRDRAGKRQLRLTERLTELAHRHSKQMARRGELYHSNLRRVFRGFNFRMVGENVGYGYSLDQLLNAFMDSPPHHQNLVGQWKRTGVGVWEQGGKIWITQLFYR